MRLLALTALASTLLAFRPVTAAPLDCKSPEFVTLVGGATPFDCVEMESHALATTGQPITIRLVRDSRTDPQQVQQYGPQAVAAAETALAAYASLRSFTFNDISIVLMNPAEPWPAHDLGYQSNAASGECVVRVFGGEHDTIQLGDALAAYNLTVAHEVFHCVQDWTWPAAKALYGKGAAWWVESSAEYFSQRVFPDANRMAFWSKAFNDAIAKTPLTEQPYAAFVFFAWADAVQPGRALAILDEMPKSGEGEDRQRRALLNVVNGVEMQTFAQAWADGAIPLPGGGVSVAPQPQESETVDQEKDLQFDRRPLAIQLKSVQVAKGEYVALEYGGGSVSATQRAATGGAWDSIPLKIAAESCDDVLNLLMVRMPTTEDNTAMKLQFKLTKPCEKCFASEVRDACVIGKWRLDNDTLMSFLNSSNPKNTRYTSVGGQAFMVFDKQGQAQLVIEGLDIQAVVEIPGSPVSHITVQADGIDMGAWSADQGKLTYCAEGSGVEFTSKVAIEDIENEQKVTGFMQNSDHSYICANDLNLNYIGPLNLGEHAPRWRLERVK